VLKRISLNLGYFKASNDFKQVKGKMTRKQTRKVMTLTLRKREFTKSVEEYFRKLSRKKVSVQCSQNWRECVTQNNYINGLGTSSHECQKNLKIELLIKKTYSHNDSKNQTISSLNSLCVLKT
jgi:hypothetical protein